jgi:hypothetical protein
LNIILFLARNNFFDPKGSARPLSFPIPESFYDISHLLFSAEFRVSTRRLPAAARRRTEVHRVRAVRQKQRRNHPKEPLKTKQTQFAGSPNERNFCFNKELRRISAAQHPKNKPKQTQFQTQRSLSGTGNNILLFMPNVGYNTLYYCFLLYSTLTSDDKQKNSLINAVRNTFFKQRKPVCVA